MVMKARFTVIGKFTVPFIASDGTAKESPKVNIAQDNGKVIETLRVTLEQFNVLETGLEYTANIISGNGKNGLYLKVLDIAEAD